MRNLSIFSKLTWKQIREELWRPIGDVLIGLILFILSISWLYKVAAIEPEGVFRIAEDLKVLPNERDCLLVVGFTLVIAILSWAALVLSINMLYTSALKAIKLEEPVTFNFGQTLPEVMKKIRREPLEYLALCDKNGKVLYTGTIYSPSETRLNDDDFEATRGTGGLIMLHNHPTGTAFSPNDFACVFSYRISKSVLIAKNTVFELEAPANLDNFDPAEVKTFAEQQALHTLELMSMAGCKLQINEDGSSYYVRGRDLRLASVLVCDNVAKHYGMKFTATPYRKSKYCQRYRLLVLAKLLLTGIHSWLE